MAKNRKNKKAGNKLSSIERMLKKKADSFLKAEKEFWKHRYSIEQQHKESATALGLDVTTTIPDELSSIVWALKDGVSFVRYLSPGAKGRVDFRSLDISLEQWGNEGLIIPTPQGEISLVKAGLVSGLGNIMGLINSLRKLTPK